ncbi:MAG: serine hydrolase domain-containing protein [Candidatus Latescibacterota bacterium]
MDTAAMEQALREVVAHQGIPGAVLVAGHEGCQAYSLALGRAALVPCSQPMLPGTLFDLASLTKVLATTTLAMQLVEQGGLDLDRSLEGHLPGRYGPGLASVTPRLLLAHAAGLPAHVPLHQGRPAEPADPEVERRQALERVRRLALAWAPGRQCQYSDLGMIVLGDLLEGLAGDRLDRLFETLVAVPLGLPDTFFVHLDQPLPRARRAASAFAPTEECPWRGRLVRGQVHDENAYLLRGVAGHAGLFSAAADLQRLVTVLLACWHGESPFLSAGTLGLFTRREEGVPGSSRALGWDTPSPGASCGTLFGERAFGHTGFTGTSIWIQPECRRYVILLTNRIHPTRQDRGFLGARPALHDRIVRAMPRA